MCNMSIITLNELAGYLDVALISHHQEIKETKNTKTLIDRFFYEEDIDYEKANKYTKIIIDSSPKVENAYLFWVDYLKPRLQITENKGIINIHIDRKYETNIKIGIMGELLIIGRIIKEKFPECKEFVLEDKCLFKYKWEEVDLYSHKTTLFERVLQKIFG